ncbi:Origin recognition complex subunit 5 [Holothuria leucospilota]|uniref:Origin recognition complex subunit 5 n=1 Tax=Holothuria leucospilota TaxID=206669 RepID=A0A9Q1HJ41_HOLLE|nr:Origin recognition complex subunit 5 [Holothuria leucospilota]
MTMSQPLTSTGTWNQEILCRNKQITLLQLLMGKKSHATPPAIFIYGHSSTGKTFVTKKLLKSTEAPHASINCVECYSQRLLYEEILGQLSGQVLCAENNYTRSSRCETMNEFVRLLKIVIEENEWEDQTVYIVLDNAERLRNMEGHILPVFLRLSELSKCNVCVILLTQIIWEKFSATSGYVEPLKIHFPDYSKNELLEIMTLDTPEGFSKAFYSSYVNLLLSVFHMACRDLSELRHLALINFPKYIQPIEKGEATQTDVHKLWRNIEPHLKKALQTLFLREVSSSQWEEYQENDSSSLPPLLSSTTQVELPFYSKYLLIAAYLASYNPAKSDRRFFAKNHGKIQQTKRMKKAEASSQLIGPKVFQLERLMAIFYSIVDVRVTPSAELFAQISSLVSLQMLSQIGSGDQLDTPKFRCCVSLEFIRSVSRTVNFDIMKYLYEFAA